MTDEEVLGDAPPRRAPVPEPPARLIERDRVVDRLVQETGSASDARTMP